MNEDDTIIYNLQVVRYVDVASVAILVFDYALTFEREVSLIWRSKWSLPKVLFLLSRYSTVLDVPLVLYYSITPVVSVQHCAQLHEGVSWGTVFGISVAEAILLVRTYALSGAKRSVLITFTSIWATAVATTIVLVALFVKSSIFILPPLPGIPGCFLAMYNRAEVVAPFVIVLLYDTVVIAYTLYLGVKNYHHSVRIPLLVTLYRDGITYYLFLFIVSLLNVFMLLNGTSPTKQALTQFFNTFVRVLHSVLSTRVILHIRDVERKNFQLEREIPLSTVRFEAQTLDTQR
ncbi:hypothetical protein MSAN_00810200 [Mycena sanguinolenta]|uniref:DUF6533 domain-containing protein n=1 Tax=Mycena sanguinolenta TaxID=230812 RepID=A0A8H6YUP4_9AGAR|nr:hypothetical protein MSAN_00810200 [Mycena sanguinolenta]